MQLLTIILHIKSKLQLHSQISGAGNPRGAAESQTGGGEPGEQTEDGAGRGAAGGE